MSPGVRPQPGLCSVTFRALAAERVIDLAADARLKGIEWASDVHVLPGDLRTARRIATACADRGLKTPSLGSYVRCVSSPSSQEFAPVLETCLALGAKTIRVWAGIKGFAEASAKERLAIAETISGYCEDAFRHGLTVALEFHPDTLTDHIAGAVWLLDQISHDSCRSYWQPVPDQRIDDCRLDIERLGRRLSHIHVFYWIGDKVRRPLAEGAGYWRSILNGRQASADRGGGDRWAFLEFVRNDDIAQFRSDSRVLVDQILGDGRGQTARESPEKGAG